MEVDIVKTNYFSQPFFPIKASIGAGSSFAVITLISRLYSHGFTRAKKRRQLSKATLP